MTHWDEYTFDRKLRAFEAIGFVQGEAVKLADVPWDNFTSEVQKALKESDDTFFGTGKDEEYKTYSDEDIEAEDKKKEETGESYDYNNIGVNELQRTKYQCEFCNCGYKSNESLSVHLNDVHTVTLGEINGYGLNACESSYYKKANEEVSFGGAIQDNIDRLFDEWNNGPAVSNQELEDNPELLNVINWYMFAEKHGISDEDARAKMGESRSNEIESPSAIGEDSETVDVFDLVHETKTDEEREGLDALEEEGQSGNPYNIFKKKSSEDYTSFNPMDHFKSEYTMDQDGAYRCKHCDVWLDLHGDYGSYSPEEVAKHHLQTEHGITDTNFQLGESIAKEATDLFDDDEAEDHETDGGQDETDNLFDDEGGESLAREDDPDFENDPDFEGKIGGKSVEPSQYTQSGMDSEDTSRGDVDFDKLGESVRSCPACNYENDGRSLSCTSCGQDFPSNEEPSVQAKEAEPKPYQDYAINDGSNGGYFSSCTDGNSHIPAEDRMTTTCEKCGQTITETGEGAGHWFTDADSLNWDDKVNDIDPATGDFRVHESRKANERSIKQACKNIGCTLERAQQVADAQGMDLQQVVDAGNLEDMIYSQDQDEHYASHMFESRANEDQDKDFPAYNVDVVDSQLDDMKEKSEELYGQNDPDEILGGSWGTPENTAQDLYNSMPHNYPEEDYSKYESMIIKKITPSNNGQFSANALADFLRAKGVTSDDLLNDLVMEYGRGTDPIW